MIGYKKAIAIPSPHYTSGRPSWVTKQGIMWIICHGAASGVGYSAQATAHDFATSNPYSTHYIVGYNGDIVQCVSEIDTAWGNGLIEGPSGSSKKGGGSSSTQHDTWWDTVAKGDPNACTISIEFSKSTDNLSALSSAQIVSGFQLISDIRTRWGKYIPAQYGNEKGGITGHYSMQPITRSYCPGPFPFDELVSYLQGHSSIQVSSGNGTTTPDSTSISVTPESSATYTSVTKQVHTALISNPGFYGVALAVDESEQFPGYIDLSNGSWTDVTGLMRSIGASISDNFTPFIIRGGLVLFGAILFILLFMKAIEG